LAPNLMLIKVQATNIEGNPVIPSFIGFQRRCTMYPIAQIVQSCYRDTSSPWANRLDRFATMQMGRSPKTGSHHPTVPWRHPCAHSKICLLPMIPQHGGWMARFLRTPISGMGRQSDSMWKPSNVSSFRISWKDANSFWKEQTIIYSSPQWPNTNCFGKQQFRSTNMGLYI
jgi:hypothetical protein